MLIKRKDDRHRGFGGHIKMPPNSNDVVNFGEAWEKTEGFFRKVAVQESREDIEKEQERERQRQQEEVESGRRKAEEERKSLAEADAQRNGLKGPATTTTKSKNEPTTAVTTSWTDITSNVEKQSKIEAPRITTIKPSSAAQVGAPFDSPRLTATTESEVRTEDLTFSSTITSSTPRIATPEPPDPTDIVPATAASQHSFNAGQIAAIVISSIGLVIILLIAIFFFLRFRRHQQHPLSPSPSNSAPLPPNYNHPYSQLLSPPPPPLHQPPQYHLDLVKHRPTISRWLSGVVRAESQPRPGHSPSISLPSSSSHSGSGGVRARTRGQPDMVSDISSQISGFTHPTVTDSSGGRSFRPPTQLRPPTGSSVDSSGRNVNVREMKPVHPSIYISPATATNSSRSVSTEGLLPASPLPPGRLMGEPVSPLSVGFVGGLRVELGMGVGMGNRARLSGLGVQGGYEQDGFDVVRRESWEGDRTLEELEAKRRSV